MVFALEIKASTWILQILFSSLFYYLISKVKLYRHHYLTIALIFSFGFIIDIILNNIFEEMDSKLSLLLIRLFKEILSSLFYVFFEISNRKKILHCV